MLGTTVFILNNYWMQFEFLYKVTREIVLGIISVYFRAEHIRGMCFDLIFYKLLSIFKKMYNISYGIDKKALLSEAKHIYEDK